MMGRGSSKEFLRLQHTSPIPSPFIAIPVPTRPFRNSLHCVRSAAASILLVITFPEWTMNENTIRIYNLYYVFQIIHWSLKTLTSLFTAQKKDQALSCRPIHRKFLCTLQRSSWHPRGLSPVPARNGSPQVSRSLRWSCWSQTTKQT